MTNLFIPGPAGQLEALLHEPATLQVNITAIICHPNPLFQGTMHNKVVTTLGKVCEALNIRSVKFNYRGVGQSEGTYGDIIGEVDDLLAIYDWVQQQYPQTTLWLMGFSFGGYIAAKGATLLPCEQLISIAPAVGKAPFEELPLIQCPWVIVQGEEDEIVSSQAVYDFAQSRAEKPLLHKMPNTGHFFHGRLTDLKDYLLKYLVDTHVDLRLDLKA